MVLNRRDLHGTVAVAGAVAARGREDAAAAETKRTAVDSNWMACLGSAKRSCSD